MNGRTLLNTIFLLLALCSQRGIAATQPFFQVTDSMEGVLVGKSLLLYEDRSQALTFNDILSLYAKGSFSASRSSIPSYGLTDSTIWAAVILVNPEPKARTIYIEHRYSSNSIALYRQNSTGETIATRLGFLEPRSASDVDFYFPVFKVVLEPGENQLFFSLNTWAPAMALFLWDSEGFARHKSMDYALNGAFFGAMCLMILYNLLIYMTSRNRENILYVFYLVSFLFLQSYLAGFGSLLIDRELLANYWQFVTDLGIIAAFNFSKSFLHFRDLRFMWRILRFLRYCLVGVGIYSLFDMRTSSLIFSPLVGLSFGIIIYAGIKRAMERYRPAYYFSLAWLCMTVCSLIILLTLVTILPFNAWSMRIGSLGVLLEMILLSLAIGEKIKVEREGHIANLSDQNQKIQHAFRQMKKVFYNHQVQLIEKGVDLEKTMPTGPGEACVICFDVIGSSRIQHEKSKDFLRNIFRRCNEIMMEGYDESGLRSNAYRIKEMGDGFLCSIGYPFKSKTGYMAMDAIQLAFRFQQAFHEEVQALDYRDPIHCGIGLALENIAGFYPEVGTKEYDLFGRAIVLATRYEALRKTIFDGQPPGSVIILHERVYLSLRGDQREAFKEFDLSAKGVMVRDDPAATKLYYCCLNERDDRLGQSPKPTPKTLVAL